MAQVKEGDKVKVHYTGKFTDGTLFDSSLEREPLEFTVGSGQIIRGFEETVLRLSPGESQTQTIPADQAYGPLRPEMIFDVERSLFPPEIQPEAGQQLALRQPDGQSLPVKVVSVAETKVTLDANHPLAGRDLVFTIQLVEIINPA